MPMHRKNRSHNGQGLPRRRARRHGLVVEDAWFVLNVKRQPRRNKIAAASRRKNRRK